MLSSPRYSVYRSTGAPAGKRARQHRRRRRRRRIIALPLPSRGIPLIRLINSGPLVPPSRRPSFSRKQTAANRITTRTLDIRISAGTSRVVAFFSIKRRTPRACVCVYDGHCARSQLSQHAAGGPGSARVNGLIKSLRRERESCFVIHTRRGGDGDGRRACSRTTIFMCAARMCFVPCGTVSTGKTGRRVETSFRARAPLCRQVDDF